MPVRMVVGLGNPPGGYRHTPHNIGLEVVDVLAERNGLAWRDEKGRAYTASFAEPRGRKKDMGPAASREPGLLLIKPQSYMNTSGPVVQWASGRWDVPPEEMLLVCDDFSLPWGRLRIRRSGSSGGHNGLKSVIESLGSQDFPRLKIGIGPVPAGVDPKDYVLQKQPSSRIRELAEKAADALDILLSEGLEQAMNRVNASAE
ncbi:MAG: aminoacyl-tRNA hydrolase [Elusimicrobia bacterium]|nr:aminoacyl-tRNA hydrolase [Elusimicrobiota bacterium]